MRTKRVLILGGTGEARELANKLVGEGLEVTTSLAGVTEHPALPMGKIRQGGFGGVAGLQAFLSAERFDHVIDATHPFAAQISRHAATAAAATATPLLRLGREAWAPERGDHWFSARDTATAVALLPQGARLMLTLGRKELSLFFGREDLSGVARMIEPPDAEVPASFTVVLQRPPYALDREFGLMREHGVQYLLSKNSGGPRAAKLDAARALEIPVIMIERPVKPDGIVVSTIDAVVALLLGRPPATG